MELTFSIEGNIRSNKEETVWLVDRLENCYEWIKFVNLMCLCVEVLCSLINRRQVQPLRWHNGLNQYSVDNLLPLTDGAVTARTDRKDILIKLSRQIQPSHVDSSDINGSRWGEISENVIEMQRCTVKEYKRDHSFPAHPKGMREPFRRHQ